MSMDGDAVDLGRTGYIDSMSRRALKAALAGGERVRDSSVMWRHIASYNRSYFFLPQCFMSDFFHSVV